MSLNALRIYLCSIVYSVVAFKFLSGSQRVQQPVAATLLEELVNIFMNIGQSQVGFVQSQAKGITSCSGPEKGTNLLI